LMLRRPKTICPADQNSRKWSAPGSGIKVSFLRWLPADWVGVACCGGASPQWQHRALHRADAWKEEAAQYLCWSGRTTLVDLRDSKMRVPTNPAVSTALPFNAAVEVLADGILASHKAHYSLNYSAKMGITAATIRTIVFAAIRKQQVKPDAADLDASQEYRRAMSTSLMAVCAKTAVPSHLMATYMLRIKDFYVSHDFVDVHHFNFHPFKRRPAKDDTDDGNVGADHADSGGDGNDVGSDGDDNGDGDDGGDDTLPDISGTWIRVGQQLVLTSQLAYYASRYDPALASADDVLWAPAQDEGIFCPPVLFLQLLTQVLSRGGWETLTLAVEATAGAFPPI
jgi:hypothetical protein